MLQVFPPMPPGANGNMEFGGNLQLQQQAMLQQQVLLYACEA
jgi:hypothetical protein